MTPRIHPVARYEHAREAIDWLARAFGFEARAIFDGPGDTVAHAELTFGAGTIGISSAGPVDPANVWTTVREGLYVSLADPDTHHARARAAGATIERGLQDMEYGSRDYTARDVGRHLWCFGTYAMGHEPDGPVFTPELRYADGRVAVDFLVRAFGLEAGLEIAGPDADVHHAELWLGDSALMVAAGPDPDGLWCGRRQCTHVRLADPDAHFARARAAGATIVRPPHDTPYGARGYLAQDVEGLLWGFSTYRPQRPAGSR
ncbi:MAG: VOC family protein [Vicinamibacterales bacterium]